MASQPPRRCFHCINNQQLRPFLEKREFPSWLCSCFIDPMPYFCQSGLIVETEVSIAPHSLDSSLFLVYLPLQQTYLAFQIHQGNIYILISQRHHKYLKYRIKEDNYHHLTVNASYEKHIAWKQKCSFHAFINYSLYWLWREECQRQNSGTRVSKETYDDYSSYAKFRQECKITMEEGEKIRIYHGKHVMTFFHQRWINYWSKEDFSEWKEYCQWKSKYYAQRCLYYESIPTVTWLHVAKCQRKACLTFIIFPDRVFWEIDGYQVYTYTPSSPIHKVNIGIGMGGKNYYHRPSENNSCFAYFSTIYLYSLLIPMTESCLTSQDTIVEREEIKERVSNVSTSSSGKVTTTTSTSTSSTKKSSNSNTTVKSNGTSTSGITGITGTTTNLPSLEIKTHLLTTSAISHPSEGALTTSLDPSHLPSVKTANSSFNTDDLNKIPSSSLPSHV